MREYIRENLKIIIAITALLVCTLAFICTNELVAKKAPEISTLEVMEVKLSKGQVFEYTGKEVTPKIKYVLFEDEEGNEIKKEQKEITSLKYKNNVKIGNADAEVEILGYEGSVLVKDVFSIQLGKVEGLKITSASRTNIDLTWNKVTGADGYSVYRSVDNGETYTPVMEIQDKEVTTFQDIDIQPNVTYMYYVCAYSMVKENPIYGEVSDIVSQLTPIDTAVLVSVQGVSYNTVELQWNVVNGAVGYQVYRSLTADGEYTCIAEIADGAVAGYSDATCELGKGYFYYIKACQLADGNTVYGEASQVMSGKPIPNKVTLSGNVSEDQTQVTLSWKETNGAQGFEIYRSNGNTSNFQLVQKIEQGNVLSWTDTGLDKNAEYKYRVRAYCVVDGQTITGNNSNVFTKEVVIVYNYAAYTGDTSVITQYAGQVPYVWGGKSTSGWDCSGYVGYVYKNHFGIDIGMGVSTQYRKGISINMNDRSTWKTGDLLFYTEGAGPSHVAIYLGNGQMIHALSPKYGTIIHDVDYYEKWDRATSLIAVKRIFQ